MQQLNQPSQLSQSHPQPAAQRIAPVMPQQEEPGQSGSTKWSFPESIPARTDRVSAAIVRKSITLQQIHGTAYAVAYLKEKNINMEVALRVLVNLPAYRRREDLVDHLAVQAAVSKAVD